MAHNLTDEDLLRNRNNQGPLSFSDGLVATVVAEIHGFITSPNRTRIPCPPLGSTRDLYRRSDGFYGHDDPVQCPQPYNENYRYLVCVPTQPRHPVDPYFDDSCMWDRKPHPTNFATRDGQPSRTLDQLQKSVDTLRQRTKSLLVRQPYWRNKLAELHVTIDLSIRRLSSGTLSLRNLVCAVSELQRLWRTAVAIIDFAEIYLPRMLATEDLGAVDQLGEAQSVGSRMGAFVWNEKDAMVLFRAKLPVYYLRQFTQFDRQVILEISPFIDLQFDNTAASPAYPVIYRGQAGSDGKFAAIRVASIECYNTASPFENLHLNDAYQSLYVVGTTGITSPSSSLPSTSTPKVGPIRTTPQASASGKKGKSKRSRPIRAESRGDGALEPGEVAESSQTPLVSRDLFADLPSEDPLVPPPIPAWKNANGTINKSHPEKGEMLPQDNPRLKTVLPDPNMILGSPDPDRRRQYLAQWAHIRGPFVRETAGGDNRIPIPLKTAVWRKVLSSPTHGLLADDTPRTKNKQVRDHDEATKWLRGLFAKHAPGVNPVASPDTTVDVKLGRQMLYELSVVNFWYQLMALDAMADSTTPNPSPGLSVADLAVERARHNRHRLGLMFKVLGVPSGCDPFEVASLRTPVAIGSDVWAVRLPALRALWRLMSCWPGEKGPLWSRGDDENLECMEAAGLQWEQMLVRFYVQTYFNFLGFPPILPRTKVVEVIVRSPMLSNVV
ncbi:hypothetical protein PQX77_020670 [Marasmius sp. AFHP31]|nr:hypothetical protein PQX77_020670 [Marasmius sp. AFHP31]